MSNKRSAHRIMPTASIGNFNMYQDSINNKYTRTIIEATANSPAATIPANQLIFANIRLILKHTSIFFVKKATTEAKQTDTIQHAIN